MKRLFLLSSICLLCSDLSCQTSSDYSSVTQKTDSFIKNKMKERNIPGVSLAVLNEGKIIFSKNYGFANLEHKSPVTDSTVFQLYSITKSFTAMAIMILVGLRCILPQDLLFILLALFNLLQRSGTVI
jgi:CubicO group peptidase (beta-lactamase class C family)